MTRLLLCLLVVACFVLCAAAMRRGWHNRARRQSYLPPLPEPPARPGTPLLPPVAGTYVSTTTAGDWQDRIVAGGIGARSRMALSLYDEGLLVDRTGARALWIPADALRDAYPGRAMAGKVLGVAGLLVVRWRLGEHELDTGLLADDQDVHPEWITAIRALAPRAAIPAGAQGGDDR